MYSIAEEAVIGRLTRILAVAGLSVACLTLASLALAIPARAENAYIQQAGGSGERGFAPTDISLTPNLYAASHGSDRTNYQAAVPISLARNLAASFVVGNYNRVTQIQTGKNDTSNVGIFGGNNNDVGILQGSNDRANVGLIGTQGQNLGVIQGNNATANVLVARIGGVNVVVLGR